MYNRRKIMMRLVVLTVVVAAVVAAGVYLWPVVKARVLVDEGFYPIVSREVAAYREADKKKNLGVMEPDHSGLYREFAGVAEDSVDMYATAM